MSKVNELLKSSSSLSRLSSHRRDNPYAEGETTTDEKKISLELNLNKFKNDPIQVEMKAIDKSSKKPVSSKQLARANIV